MSLQQAEWQPRRLLSLPMLISGGLVLAALVPLIAILVFSNMQTRPALINQASRAMASDALTRAELLDNYFNERVSDAYTLTQVPVVQEFMALPADPQLPAYQSALPYATYALMAGVTKDKDYTTWTLFDPTGQVRLSYPRAPKPHGQYLVPPAALQAVSAGKQYVSPVYYDPTSKTATIEFYAPLVTSPGVIPTQPQGGTNVGFIRSTLTLNYIWNTIVQKDLGNNGDGSYAFVLDEHGVRIADTSPARRFTSVAPLPATLQQQIQQEQRYGTGQLPAVLADHGVDTSIHAQDNTSSFQEQPAQQSGQFQVERQAISTQYVHWNYFVLSPVDTVTAVANQEFYYIAIVAVVVSLLVAVCGLLAGQGIARPIMRSVVNLRDNSNALSTLAASQQDAAGEQVWVVDASQIGLQSVQYYTDASKIALRQLREATAMLAQYWTSGNAQQVERALERIMSVIKYLEHAAEYQNTSNQKLATALKVTTQVTEQLNAGAASATTAAAQLEDVVRKLRAVVGR